MPKLARRVFAGGQWWEAGSEPPAAVAATIRNPRNWATDEDDDTTDATDTAAAARRGDGPRLARRIYASGQWYGPDDEVPAEVARAITNPKAWEGGQLPTFADMADGADTAPEGGSDDETTTPDAGVEQPMRLPAPARSGRGSGRDAWEAYLKANNVQVTPGASREDLIAAAEDAGLVDKE